MPPLALIHGLEGPVHARERGSGVMLDFPGALLTITPSS